MFNASKSYRSTPGMARNESHIDSLEEASAWLCVRLHVFNAGWRVAVAVEGHLLTSR